MKYRREIDGLRALAVIPVILFHAGFGIFSGGFIGVDIFFVISGYLITTILIEDLENKRFSFLTFYERRARRILPALIVVILCCIPFSWFWMLPDQMRDFWKSLASIGLFASNIQFWRESGYFQTAAEEKPLLHTWSLAVEEQFYILFPVFLFFAWRLRKRWVFVLIATLAIASFTLCEWGSHRFPSANFYLTPPRAWELLTGSMSAFIARARGVRANNFLATLGLIAIIAAIFLFDRNTPSPSHYLLLPISGVVLLILFADQNTLAAKILGGKVLVGIGLMSYSAYLWHQPLFSFFRISSLDTYSNPPRLLLVLGSFALGSLSWKFVEKPFRITGFIPQKIVFALSLVGLLLPLGTGLLMPKFGMPTYFEMSNPQFEIEPKPQRAWVGSSCDEFFPKLSHVSCSMIKNPHPKLKVVIWGDSQSGTLRGDTPNTSILDIISLEHGGCPPLLGVARFDRQGTSWRGCSAPNSLVPYLDWINKQNADVVILTARWSLYLNGSFRGGLLEPSHHFLKDTFIDEDLIIKDPEIRRTILEQALQRTITALKAKHVVILDQPMDYANIRYKTMVREGKVSRSVLEPFNSSRYEVFSKLKSIDVISPNDTLCDDQSCFTRFENKMIYSDDNHLTSFGASIVWTKTLLPYLSKLMGEGTPSTSTH